MRSYLLLIPVFVWHVCAQNAVIEVAPMFGPPGTEVSVFLQQHHTGSIAVKIGDTTATAALVNERQIRFLVPASANSGELVVRLGTNDLRLNRIFTVTRPLPVAIDAGTLTSSEGYTIGSLYGDSVAGQPGRIVQIALGEPSIVAASAGEEKPPLFSVAGSRRFSTRSSRGNLVRLEMQTLPCSRSESPSKS